MMVLPVAKALELDAFPRHEDVKDDLVEWKSGMADVAFFSHTWLSWRHPDSKSRQKWTLLRTLLRKAVGGQLDISAHTQAAAQGWFDKQYKKQVTRMRGSDFQKSLSAGFIWVDFVSIPQAEVAREEQARAIASLSAYVSHSRYFFVLAGAWEHDDDHTVRDAHAWMKRGCACGGDRTRKPLHAAAPSATVRQSLIFAPCLASRRVPTRVHRQLSLSIGRGEAPHRR